MVEKRKIKAITDWPLPSNVSTLRIFLSMTNFYRRFVKGYGIITKPLTKMLKKDNFV